MPLSPGLLTGKFSLRRLGCWLVLMTVTMLSGCTSLNDYRGERFQEDKLFDNVGQLRRHDDRAEPIAFSNKARQISESCGGSR